jgi:ribose transport system permease protein
MKRILSTTLTGQLLAFIVVVSVIGVTTDRFFDLGNLSNLALQVSVVSLVAIGSTLVILTGGIDLSPGSAIALLSMVLALLVKTHGVPLTLAVPLVLLSGAGLGAVLGAITAYLRIPSFIASLAAFSAFRGLAFIPTNGAPLFSVSDDLSKLFYGSLLRVPLPLYYVLIAYCAAFVFLDFSPLGRKIYAVGGNARAAQLSGINVARLQCLVFVLAGVTYAAAAILFAARLNSGSPNYGTGMELQAIAAAVIGGVSLSGGRGNILGTLLGALIITVVQNAMNLNGIGSSLQAVIIGGIILIAVGIDRWRSELGQGVTALLPEAWRPVGKRAAKSNKRGLLNE